MDWAVHLTRTRQCRSFRVFQGAAPYTDSLQAYALHQRIFNASTVARQRKLKAEILATKKELLQTSAQDQFAKWAKLRRSVDKGLADLEKISCVSSNLCVPAVTFQ